MVTYIVNLDRVDGDFNISNFFLDGFFLFFAISISSSIVYDFFMDAEIPKSEFWDTFGRYINLFLILVLIGIIVFSMLLYSSLYLFKALKTNFKRDTLVFCEQLILFLSFILALGLKWVIYYHNILKSSKT